ncbi:MAG: hypothetical protein CM15mV88_100 [Caudoviricetes sp.]|nr:MAG: hypothetical protein CM15mV88_100 [Caudoviricetes sp.]
MGQILSFKKLTGDLYITNSGDNERIYFQKDDGSGGLNYFYLDGNASNKFLITTFPDNSKNYFLGNGRDVQIFHNNTDSFLSNSTGHLNIQNSADDKDILFLCDKGEVERRIFQG